MARMYSRFLPLLLLALVGIETSAAAEYRCVNVAEGKGTMSSEFRERLETLRNMTDLAERERLTKKAVDASDYPLETALAKVALANLWILQGRHEEAYRLLEEQVEKPYLTRAQIDGVRSSLGVLALRRKDYALTIGCLEPMFLANCAPMPSETYYLLADAYLNQQRPSDALRVLDAAPEQSSADKEWWTAVQSELRCKLKGPAACVSRFADLARDGGLSEDMIHVGNTLLVEAIKSPEAAEALVSARAEGLIDEQGRIVNRAPPVLVELEPVTRVAPDYPREAALAGVSGYVNLVIHVDATGKPKQVTVLDSSPKGYFEAAAVSAARKAVFKPQLRNGHPVEYKGQYMLRFQISR